MKNQFSIVSSSPHERPSRSFMGGAALVALFVLLLPLPVEAARLWSSGFELQSVTSAVEWDTVTGSPSISTSLVRSGSASMRCNPTAATAYMNKVFTSASNADWYGRFYLYIASPTDALDSFFLVHSSSFGDEFSLRMNTDRTIEVWNDFAGTQTGTDLSALGANSWYRFEVSFTNNDTWTVKIDGTTVFTDTDAAYNGPSFDDFSVGCITATTADLYFDDVAINNTSGSMQTSWSGPGKIVHLQPDAAGDTDNSTTTPTGWEQVDEVTPDDATSVAWLDADGDILDVNLESSASAGIDQSSAITLVHGGIREREDTSGAASATWQLGVKSQSSGTVINGTATAHNDGTYRTNGDVAPRNYTLTSYTNPETGSSWTPSLLDSAQIRASSTDALPDIGITTLWALVEYVVPQARLGLKNARIKFSGGRIILRSTNQ